MQDPQGTLTPERVQSGVDLLNGLDSIEWIDWTALIVMGVFFILGLFKGLVWQVSRVVILIAAWCLAGRFGIDGASFFGRFFDPEHTPAQLPLYLSYVSIFLLAVIMLSLVAWVIQKIVQSTGLTLYDRLGGALVGVATGALLVTAVLAGLFMFVPESYGIVQAAHRSRSMHLSQRAIRLLGEVVPEPVQDVFKVRDEKEDGDEKPGGDAEKAEPRQGLRAPK